jgi:hypothetical protein
MQVAHGQFQNVFEQRFSSTVPSLLMSAPRKDEVPQSIATSF